MIFISLKQQNLNSILDCVSPHLSILLIVIVMSLLKSYRQFIICIHMKNVKTATSTNAIEWVRRKCVKKLAKSNLWKKLVKILKSKEREREGDVNVWFSSRIICDD